MENPASVGPVSAAPKPSGFWGSFLVFLKQYSVIGLAIGVVMGAAVNSLVQAIVQGLVMPLIGLLIPGQGIQRLIFHVQGVDFRVGDVVSALIQFVVIALLVYFVVKTILKQDALLPKNR